ncbi:hypothetical protein CPB83DRAFT_875297 [Crepidotus variabilis]|uniref:Nibrin n=1 Tax=Crepidotus variabilis TaxID=179855 RepID=A0A9P6JQV2_9AGAR|nr:hypothetical protein CPB83DRAFT_875297 [Crepidotus variabilis]
MWTLVGPFDGEVAGDSDFQKSKLVKPGTSYTVGRKDRPLLVNNKKISHDHCDFVVGPHSTEDASIPGQKPTIELVNRNKKDKTLLISRKGKDVAAYPSSNEPLEDGDVVTLISGITILVKWEPVCVLASASKQYSLEDCAALGIKLVQTPQISVSHHATAEYVADLRSSASLLSLCQFVRPEWLDELIRLGKLPRKDNQNKASSLEDRFLLPSETKYRPEFSSSLHPTLKNLNVWQPNEERVGLFRGLRFLCLQEKASSQDAELREVLQCGEGTLETFDIHSGPMKFCRALTRCQAKEGTTTVVVGNLEALQVAVGLDTWKKLLSEAQSCGLMIHPVSEVVQTVLSTSCEPLLKSILGHDGSSCETPSLPSEDRNIVSQDLLAPLPQASQASSRSRLVRRVTSRASSREPSAPPPISDVHLPEDPPPRKMLTRRVRTMKQLITGIDDPSSVIDAVPDLSNVQKTPPPQVMDLTAPTPARTSKLKRRLGTTKESTQSLLTAIQETVREPPLKKFKALFEATNLEGTDSQSEFFSSGDYVTQSQDLDTQVPNTQSSLNTGAFDLDVLREEEEESQANYVTEPQLRRSKRRLSSEDDVAQQIVAGSRATSTEPANKKRAIERVNSVQTALETPAPIGPQTFVKPSTNSVDKCGTGTATGYPDKDEPFLKAIASTKRGKKYEDDFDREFNKLKISKPELDQRDPEEDWNILADFGDDSGLRGNFMVIVEMEVFRQNSAVTRKGFNAQWNGKPNFKKFKKKNVQSNRQTVDLVVSEENDYGMGTTYWKSGQSQGQNQTQRPQLAENESQDSLPRQKKKTLKSQLELEDDAEQDHIPRRAQRATSRKPPSRTGSEPPKTIKMVAKGKAPAQVNTLFLNSDDDTQELGEQPDTIEIEQKSEETLKSSPEEKEIPSRRITRTTVAKKPSTRAKKPPVVVVDDDSDDAIFKGFKGKGR